MNMADVTNPKAAEWLIMLAKARLKYANKGYGCKREAMTLLNRARAKLRHLVNGTKPEPCLSVDFYTNIGGIPCGIVVDSFTPAREWRQHTFPGAGPGDCDAPEPEEVEFTITDTKGYPAGDWLTSKADMGQLECEVIEWCRNDH